MSEQPDPHQPPSSHVEFRDSRRAANRILRAGERKGLRRFIAFIFVGTAAIWTWRQLTAGLDADERSVLFLFLLAVGLWITEAVPAFAVGLLIMGYLVFVFGTPIGDAEVRDITPYLETWSSPVIWLMLGGFFMADAMSRTGLDRRLFRVAMRPAGDRPERVLLAIMLTSAVASMFISNTSATALLIGAVLPFVRALGTEQPFSRALLVGIPLAASVGGMGTIIGSPPNAIAAGAAARAGSEINFVAWMGVGIPLALTLVLLSWRFLLRRYPAGDELDATLGLDDGAPPELTLRRDRRVVAGICLTTIILWITEPLHGIHVSLISMIPIVGLTMSQITGASQVRGLPWDTLMLVAGGLSLGAAVVDSGLAARIAGGIEEMTGGAPDLTIFLLLALLTVTLSNFMSNTATVSLILPVAVAMVPDRALELCLILGLSGSCALLLPVSTPPNAIAFSTGLITTRDLRPTGLLIGLLGPLLILLWVPLTVYLAGLVSG